MQRKDEILAKKAKLAELRRQREERERKQKELSARDANGEASVEVAPTPPKRNVDRKDLDSIIDNLVGNRRLSYGGTSSPSARKHQPTSTTDVTQAEPETVAVSPEEAPQVQSVSVATQTLSTVPATVNYEYIPTSGPQPEAYSYSKGIQTSDFGSPPRRKKSLDRRRESDSDSSTSFSRSPRNFKRRSRREREREEELRQNLRREIEEEVKAAQKPVPDAASTEAKYPARPLTEEELAAVTASDEFLEFVERSTKVIERALDQDYNILADYSLDGVVAVDSDEDDVYGRSKGKKGRRLRQIAQFYDERWSKKRMISDIDFSSRFPELLLASYTKNPSAPADPAGLLQVWNLHLHSRPEYTFHAASDLLTAQFSPFHPALLIGGTYSGQVLIWDTRSRSSLPSQKTPLTGAASGGHTHPIYSIAVVGTQNANNIMSCSTDGVVCGWTADMLSQPQEYLILTAPPPSKTEDLSPLCMSFPPADPTSFLVGTEEGTIYPCHRYDRAGAGAGTDTRLRYKGHTAPVTSLNFHPARGRIDFGDLFLSTGLDWSVKLWKSRPASSTSVAASSAGGSGPGANSEIVEPLLDLSREDVVYDAKWSPQRPGVFSAVDGAGNVEVWDLTVDTEVPVARTSPEVNKQAQGAYAAKALNKVTWEEKEGKRLATGGAAGVVSVFEVGSALAGESVRMEEWTGMKRLTGRLERVSAR
ncbi:MAG: hypothetical protein Q9207_007828 [Kuettlingeria erythrocarpa]